jgi:hypothetical protein
MNELEELKNYSEYKAALDKQIKESAEGFVKIGYLLKLAKDTDILKDSQYSNVIEFARAEYGIDKTMVSRFISINDRFSEDGNSPVLRTTYQGFGYAKLAIMLQLPDRLNEELTPEYSKREIQTLKEEMDKEKTISDLEIYAEGKDSEKTELEQIVYKICEENIEVYERIYKAVTHEQLTSNSVINIFAPAGDMIYSVRVQGAGRKAVSFKQGEDVSVVSLRTSEKDTYNPQEVLNAVVNMIARNIVDSKNDAKTVWQQIYGIEYPKKDEVAPVQQNGKTNSESKKPEKKMKVVKAKQEEIHNIEKSVPKVSPIEQSKELEKPIKTESEHIDEQLEGQKNIEDYPEVMPDVEQVEGTVENIPLEDEKLSENKNDIPNDENDKYRNPADIRNNILTSITNIKFALEVNEDITNNIIDRLIALTDNIKTELEELKKAGGSR